MGELFLPPRSDGYEVPIVEWWDEAYLSREIRENRKKNAIKFNGSSSSGSNSQNNKYGKNIKIESSSSDNNGMNSEEIFIGSALANVRTHM